MKFEEIGENQYDILANKVYKNRKISHGFQNMYRFAVGSGKEQFIGRYAWDYDNFVLTAMWRFLKVYFEYTEKNTTLSQVNIYLSQVNCVFLSQD